MITHDILNFSRLSFCLLYLIVFWYLAFWRKEERWEVSFKIKAYHIFGLSLILLLNTLFLFKAFIEDFFYLLLIALICFISISLLIGFYRYYGRKFYYLSLSVIFLLLYVFLQLPLFVLLSFAVISIFFIHLVYIKVLSVSKSLRLILCGISLHFIFLGLNAVFPHIIFNFLATMAIFFSLFIRIKEIYKERLMNSILYLTSFTLVSIVLIGLGQKYINSMKQMDEYHKKLMMERISAEIKNTTLFYINFIRVISNSKDFLEHFEKGYEVLSDYLTYLNNRIGTELIFFVNKDGTIKSVSANYKGIINKTVKDRRYFREAINGKTSVFIARGILTNREDIRVANPVSVNNKTVGVLVFQFPLSDNFKKLVETENAFVMHETGLILIGKEEFRNRLLMPLDEKKISELYKEKILGNDRILNSNFKQIAEDTFTNEKGESFILVKEPINQEWFLCSLISLSIYEKYKAVFYAFMIFLAFISHSFAVRSFERIRERLFKLIEDAEEKRIFFDSIDIGVIHVDKLGRIRYINREAKRLLNIDNDGTNRFLQEFLFLKDSENSEYKILKTSNRQIPVIYTENPVIVQGRKLGEIITIKDATNIIVNQQLQRRVEILDTITKISSGIVHDFNNYLMVITGNLSLLKEILKDERYKQHIKSMLNATEMMSNIIEQFEALSPDLISKKEYVNIEAIIKSILDLVLNKSNINYEITNESSSLIYADPRQIYRVFQNLIVNAKQAMKDEGKISVKIEEIINEGQLLSLSKGKYILVTIEDTGPGIPEEYIDKIFDPFFTMKKEGKGLGLSIVKNLVEKLNGRVEVESKVGKGTKFKIYLPIY